MYLIIIHIEGTGENTSIKVKIPRTVIEPRPSTFRPNLSPIGPARLAPIRLPQKNKV